MTPADALKCFRARFRYRADRFGRYRILTAPTGPVHGDCEDFALTLVWLIADRSWLRMAWHILTFRAVIWFCLSPRRRPHTCLWYRGAGWTDNIWPYWEAERQRVILFPIVPPLLLLTAGYSMIVTLILRGLGRD